MAYSRVQKSAKYTSSQKKQSRIVPPPIDIQTQADSLPASGVVVSGIPSKAQRDAIRRSLFEKWAGTGQIQAKAEAPQPQSESEVIASAEKSTEVKANQHQSESESLGTMGLPIQAKLTIGEPGDKYEQEADRVAAQVVSQINAPAPHQSTQSQSVQREAVPEEEMELMMKPEISTIQREAVPEEEEELQMKSMVQLQPSGGGMAAAPDLEESIQQARGSGQPLADSIQQPMEQAFGADFSGVKVHTDAQSDMLNRSIQARAFTTGQDVFFRQGEYNPGSRGGQELIAHELTHVVQQNGGAVQRSQHLVEDRLIQEQPNPSTTPAEAMFQSQSLEVQTQRAEPSQQPDLKTSLMRSQRYGHQLNRANLVGASTPVAVQRKIGKAEVVQLANQIESSSQQANEQQEVRENTQSHKIPALVHFIWIGKKPTEAAVKNINQWVAKAENTNWKIYLWTDKRHGTPQPQYNWWGKEKEYNTWGLKGTIENKEISTALDERLKKHYKRALDKEAWNMASDLARYSILSKEGGVYADVDIGPGNVSLKEISDSPSLFAGELPLFGPGLRDMQQLDKMVPPNTEAQLETRLTEAIEELNATGQFGNHFIATPSQNALIENIIKACEDQLNNTRDDDISPSIAMMRTGPTIVLQQIEKYLAEKKVPPDERRAAINRMNPLLGKLFAKLDWLTKESENKTHQ